MNPALMKDFGLYFRYRDTANTLCEVGLVCQATSQSNAKRAGKSLERPQDKVWFMGLMPADDARSLGGKLP